jgi:hypothetical protein
MFFNFFLISETSFVNISSLAKTDAISFLRKDIFSLPSIFGVLELISKVKSLKAKIENLKENEVASTPKIDCKEKISFLKNEIASVLAREEMLTNEVSDMRKKLKNIAIKRKLWRQKTLLN